MREDCLDRVVVDSPRGHWELGPLLPACDEAFAGNYTAKRMAFAFERLEGGSFVWVDGTVYGPYPGITMWPVFSENGAHVSYGVRTKAGNEVAIIVDGRTVLRGEGFTDQHWYLLDDGRVAISRYRPDKKEDFIVGDFVLKPIEQICFRRGPKNRWALAGITAEGWRVVIDGRTIGTDHLPTGCNVEFTEDGERYGYVAVGPRPAGGSPAVGAVVDGVYHPMPDGAIDSCWCGSIPLVRAEKDFPKTRDHELS